MFTKNFEVLNFQYDLFWLVRKKTFTQLFKDDSFVLKFCSFLNMPQGKKWLDTVEGKKYKRWLEGR